MKCEKCNNKIKINGVEFFPFCGTAIKEKAELAKYTRLQFFAVTGDDEFRKAWEEVKNMSADEALKWLRECPPVHYVYRIFGRWEEAVGSKKDRIKEHKVYISNKHIKKISELGTVFSVRSKLYASCLNEIGINVFLTKKECDDAIIKAINSEDKN